LPIAAFVLGPTGSGKSDLAITLAAKLDGEIVNCDSLQLYKRLDIGTAKPPVSERRNIPHHLLDVLEPNQVFSAGEFARQAKGIIEEIHSRGRLPIVAGGTGFYVRALTEGLFESPSRDEELRAGLVRRESRRTGVLHRFLRRLDRSSAERIHPNDVQKVVRAVEVCLRSGQAMSSQFGHSETPLTGFRIVKLGLSPDRKLLYERINRRCERMLRAGLRGEVEQLLAEGFDESAKAMESIGYKQMLDCLQGRCTEAEALASMDLVPQRSVGGVAGRVWR
jgi:tRNA dimethylallyltransferase